MTKPLKPKTAPSAILRYRSQNAKRVPGGIGVYALCDLEEVPIYVGQSTDGIRARVNRHITSARSDVIANRQVDVWEIAFVWCWPVSKSGYLNDLESYLFHKFHSKSRLMNGTIPQKITRLSFPAPECFRVQLMPNEEIKSRLQLERRLPRQAKHFGDLLDHFLNVKDSAQLLFALKAHFQRLSKYFSKLSASRAD